MAIFIFSFVQSSCSINVRCTPSINRSNRILCNTLVFHIYLPKFFGTGLSVRNDLNDRAPIIHGCRCQFGGQPSQSF